MYRFLLLLPYWWKIEPKLWVIYFQVEYGTNNVSNLVIDYSTNQGDINQSGGGQRSKRNSAKAESISRVYIICCFDAYLKSMFLTTTIHHHPIKCFLAYWILIFSYECEKNQEKKNVLYNIRLLSFHFFFDAIRIRSLGRSAQVRIRFILVFVCYKFWTFKIFKCVFFVFVWNQE